MSNKGFLNLNRFKSGKAIKQQAKQKANHSRNEQIESRKGGK